MTTEPATAADVLAMAQAVRQRKRAELMRVVVIKATEKAEREAEQAQAQKEQAQAQAAVEAARRGRPSVRRVIAVTATVFGVTENDIVGTKRLSRLVKPRHAAMALAIEISGRSLCEIGKLFRKTHTTVLRGVRMSARREAQDAEFADAMLAVRERLKQQ